MATDIIPTETPSFTLLIDPPGRDYEKTSAALLYTLAAWAELIDDINPHDPVNEEILGHLCSAMGPSLLVIAEQLTSSIVDNSDLTDKVADLISLAAKKEGKS